jgi:iron complex outermembrane receptor protein
MYKPKPLAKAVSLAIATSTLSISPQVLAQDKDVAEDSDSIEEIITTGSRIRRDGFSSAAPIDVVLTENAVVSGISNLGDMMQSTTVAAGAPQVTAATSTAFVQNGGAGVSTLSLRGLGASRTLTLINGRRAGPAGTRGGVSAFDLNVIPLAAIERVEILKDGASSIYGSDAVAGVVNIYTRKDDGGSIDGYVMQPSSSGGEETRLSASWGKNFDRGNFRLTADYNKISRLNYGDRDYFACTEQYIFDDAGNRADVIDPRTGNPACRDTLWGHVWLYDYQGDGGNVPTPTRTLAQYDYDGDLGQYIPGIAVDPASPGFLVTPPGWYLVNYDRQSDAVTNMDHPFQNAASMIPEVEKTTFFGDGEFDLTDTMSVYTEVLLNRRTTDSNSYRQYWGYIYNEASDIGFGTNPLSVGWQGDQWLSPTPITDHFSNSTEVDYQRFVAGLRGDITDDWVFDVSYQYSKSDGTYTQDIIYADSIYDQNWLYDYGNGEYSCVGTNTSTRGVPCQDIPWLDPAFLAGDVSPQMREFLFGVDVGNTIYKQSSIEGYVSGGLFDLPAGQVGTAIGVHWRTDEINDVPGEQTLLGNSWGLTSAGITAGDQETTAIFGELEVPILADVTGFKSLDFNVSGRWTDVDTYGDDTTYKASLNWQVVDSFRVRATQGTSFRTPALFELYLADQTSFVRQSNIDPCIQWAQELQAGNITQRVADNCAADTSAADYPDGLPGDFPGGTITATAISSGGLGLLEAETSKSNTVGIVWQPGFADLSISLDYFDFEVKNQVDQLGAGSIVNGCYSSEFYPNEQLCDLFDRSMIGGGIDNVRDAYINISTQTSSGYDLAIKYALELGPGELSFDGQYTRTDERKTALFADNVRDNLGRFGNPENVGRLWTTYDVGDWSIFWSARYTGEVSQEEDWDTSTTYRGDPVNLILKADDVWYHDFSVTYYMNDWDMRAIVGVANAFDEEPPQVSTLGGILSSAGRSAFYSQYDWLGQRWFLNLTKSWE